MTQCGDDPLGVVGDRVERVLHGATRRVHPECRGHAVRHPLDGPRALHRDGVTRDRGAVRARLTPAPAGAEDQEGRYRQARDDCNGNSPGSQAVNHDDLPRVQ